MIMLISRIKCFWYMKVNLEQGQRNKVVLLEMLSQSICAPVFNLVLRKQKSKSVKPFQIN